MEEVIVNIVKNISLCVLLIRSVLFCVDITGCKFPFADNQNRTYNTCIITSDEFGGLIPWCRDPTGRPISCQSMNRIIN
jgi:hypothetical protein